MGSKNQYFYAKSYSCRKIMARRVTIMIDDDIDKKLRMIQAKMIQTTSESVSYSKVINEMLKKSIQK